MTTRSRASGGSDPTPEATSTNHGKKPRLRDADYVGSGSMEFEVPAASDAAASPMEEDAPDAGAGAGDTPTATTSATPAPPGSRHRPRWRPGLSAPSGARPPPSRWGATHVRGLGCRHKAAAAAALWKQQQLDIILLQETKLLGGEAGRHRPQAQRLAAGLLVPLWHR